MAPVRKATAPPRNLATPSTPSRSIEVPRYTTPHVACPMLFTTFNRKFIVGGFLSEMTVIKVVVSRYPGDKYSGNHIVDRVLGYFSSRQNWDPPPSHPQGECVPSPFGGHTRHSLVGKGVGGPNLDKGTDTVLL